MSRLRVGVLVSGRGSNLQALLQASKDPLYPARVVVVAELVGATGGVGYELLRQQQLFDMAGAIAWTLQLVLFVLVAQQTIAAIEGWALRYRAVSERAI